MDWKGRGTPYRGPEFKPRGVAQSWAHSNGAFPVPLSSAATGSERCLAQGLREGSVAPSRGWNQDPQPAPRVGGLQPPTGSRPGRTVERGPGSVLPVQGAWPRSGLRETSQACWCCSTRAPARHSGHCGQEAVGLRCLLLWPRGSSEWRPGGSSHAEPGACTHGCGSRNRDQAWTPLRRLAAARASSLPEFSGNSQKHSRAAPGELRPPGSVPEPCGSPSSPPLPAFHSCARS